MPDTVPSTDATLTTIATTTPPDGGSATATAQTTNDTTLSSAIGDGTGATKAEAGDKTGDPASKPEDKPAGAPEKYEAWKVPEGKQLDAGLVEEASPIFKELNLSQDQAQKLVDFYAKHQGNAYEANAKAFKEMTTSWRDSMKTDADLSKLVGKDGNFGPDSKLVNTVNRALDGLQNPKLVADFKDAMNLTGAGDNPAFAKILYALAEQVTEGTSYAVGGPTKAATARPTAAAAIYPNLPSQNR
jgi:hypothetical protein